MPKAKKLPSGSWRCQVSAGVDEAGKRIRESFTADTKREAELMAAEFLARKRSSPTRMTVGEAISGYIAAKENVLSAASIKTYTVLRDTFYKPIEDLMIDDVTSAVAQTWVNQLAAEKSAGTVHNAYNLMHGSIEMYAPDKKITVTLPRMKQSDIYIPTDSDVQTLLTYCAGTELEAAILLAAFGPLRRGEICALTERDIDRKNNTVSVTKNMVLNKDNIWIIKQPKTDSSYRIVTFPPDIIEKLPKRENPDDRIIPYTPMQIYYRFKKVLKKCSLPDMRFHALRHYAATVFHAIGVIDQRIMERGGWESDHVMKQIYRGSTSDIRQREDDKIFDHIKKLS